MRLISEGYKANRSAFKQGKCKFTYATWSANDEGAAIKGQHDERTPYEAMHFVLNWKEEVLTLKMPVDTDSLLKGLSNNAAVLSPLNIARKGGYAIDHDGLSNTAIVHGPTQYTLNIRYHPFNLALDSERFDPATHIDDAEARNYDGFSFEIEKDVQRDDRQLWLLKVVRTDASHDFHYYIDPERGYLPIITEFLERPNGGLYSRMFLLTVGEHGGAYFPMHAIYVARRTPAGRPTFVDVKEMNVESVDFESTPTAADFTLALSKHTQYSDGVNPSTAKTLFRNSTKANVAVSVDDLEELFQKLQNIAVERRNDAETSRAEPTQPTPRRRATIYAYVIANAAIAALIAVFLWRRRRRR